MSKNVRIFLFKLLVLAGVLIVADIAAGQVLKYLFNKQRSGKYFTTSHAVNGSIEDVLIFGNSHAAQHFDAPLMAKLLKKTVFNFGNQGQGLLYTYPLVKSVISGHKSQLIILNFDEEELKYDEADYDRLSVFTPYYHTNSVIDSTIALIPSYEYVKARSALYRYNSTIGYILLNTYSHGYNKSMESLGYDPMPGDICSLGSANDQEQPVKNIASFDSLKISRLIELIRFIQANHINLLVTTTPLFNADDKAENVYKTKLIQILTSRNVPYLDYSNNANFKDKCKLFHDASHLNPVGATLWTTNCTEYIKSSLFHKP